MINDMGNVLHLKYLIIIINHKNQNVGWDFPYL